MKAIIILGDGMSDRPVKALGNRTALQAARKPYIDEIARTGRSGVFHTIPEGMPMGSDVANLQVLGYDPGKCLTGRGALEAASLGVELQPGDVAFRLNLLTIENDRIKNHSAGHISSHEAEPMLYDLYAELNKTMGPEPFKIYKGFGFRHLLVLEQGWADTGVRCIPPHDHVGETATELYPTALSPENKKALKTAGWLTGMIQFSREFFKDHPVNARRREAGKESANSVWPWSPGNRPQMATLMELFGIRAAVISAVDLVKGIGVFAGAKIIEVPGITGLWDTNFEGKAQAALQAIEDYDMVYVHVEAPDEAAHAKDHDLKVRCIEMLDERLVRHIVEGRKRNGGGFNIAVLPDHPTFVETGAHGSEPVPVSICGPEIAPDSVQGFDEYQNAGGALGVLHGDMFMRLALGRRTE